MDAMEAPRQPSVASLARLLVPALATLALAPISAGRATTAASVDVARQADIPEWRVLVQESVAARNKGDRKTALAKAQAAYDKAKELEGENGGPALFCGAILGRALFEDGQPKEAQPYLERAIAAMYPVTDTTRPIVVDALYHLGRVHLALDDAKEGRRMLAACLEVLQSHAEAEVGLRVAVAHWYAYACYKLDDFAEARKGFERAIELVEENEGKDALELTGHLAPLTEVCVKLGDLDAALEHALRRVSLCAAHMKDFNPRFVDALVDLGAVRNERDEPKLEAEALGRAVRMLVENDRGVIPTRFKLHFRQAEALARAGDSDVAFECLDELWAALLEAKARPDQLAVAQARMAALAAKGLAWERLEAAIELLESRMDMIAEAMGTIRMDYHLKMREACQRVESHERALWHIDQGLALHAAEEERNESLAVFLRMSRGLALLDAGRCREAGDALGQAREAAAGMEPAKSDLQVMTAGSLAQHLLVMRRHDAAAEQVDQALAGVAGMEDGERQVPHLRSLLCEARLGQGDLDAAMALARQAMDGAISVEALGPRLRATLVASTVLLKRGKLEEAEELLDELVPDIAASPAQRVSRKERFDLALAELRAAQERHDEALALARRVLEACEARHSDPHQRVAEACEALASILEAAGQLDEAAKHSARAKEIRAALE